MHIKHFTVEGFDENGAPVRDEFLTRAAAFTVFNLVRLRSPEHAHLAKASEWSPDGSLVAQLGHEACGHWAVGDA